MGRETEAERRAGWRVWDVLSGDVERRLERSEDEARIFVEAEAERGSLGWRSKRLLDVTHRETTREACDS